MTQLRPLVPQNDGNGNDITAEDYAGWYTPAQTLAFLPQTWSDTTKLNVVASSLKDGLIRAVADVFTMSRRDPVRLFAMPPLTWTKWAYRADPDIWCAGTREFFSSDGVAEYRAYRVKFDPADVVKLAPPAGIAGPSQAPPPIGASQPAAHAGGRPPKAFWDALWVEMVRQMYTGDLKFSKVVEIERAMHDWLDANGHSAGETVVRERARRLFSALNKEVGN